MNDRLNDRVADAVFDSADVNNDGVVTRGEMRDWMDGGRRIHGSYDSTTGRYGVSGLHDLYDGHYDRYGYDYHAGGGLYSSDRVVHTSNAEETNHYLSSTTLDIYRDPNPRIVRRTDSHSPVVHEQRVAVRYLRPPTPPAPEPLVITEVRPAQPPPQPPLIIQEHPCPSSPPPPLVLRERPPPLPEIIPGERRTKMLEPIPVPKRSVIIEKFANIPPKPRDIIIERWLPYGPRPERRTIVEPAPPAVVYPEPTHTIILHEGCDVRVTRKFEDLGVVREDPHSYLSRYGSQLLDGHALVTEARSAGVVEDITPPSVVSYSTSAYRPGYFVDGDYYGDGGSIRRTYTSSGGIIRPTSYGYSGRYYGTSGTGYCGTSGTSYVGTSGTGYCGTNSTVYGGTTSPSGYYGSDRWFDQYYTDLPRYHVTFRDPSRHRHT